MIFWIARDGYLSAVRSNDVPLGYCFFGIVSTLGMYVRAQGKQKIFHSGLVEDCDAILDVLLQDWPDSYEAGRRALLSRLALYREGQSQASLMKAAENVYRALVGFGEEIAEMRWIHLAVECRDMLLHGY